VKFFLEGKKNTLQKVTKTQMPVTKFRGPIGRFFREEYFKPGLKGFRNEDPAAYYSLIVFCALPFMPILGWAYGRITGRDFEKDPIFVPKESYLNRMKELEKRRENFRDCFVYEYADGSTEVVYGSC
jgi:hypothetical protein